MIAASNETLLELMGCIRIEDPSAMEQFYNAVFQGLYKYAYRYLKDELDCEEVVNDTMMVVWKTPNEFEGRSKVTTWIFGVLRNQCLKKLEQRSAKKRSSLSFVDDSDTSDKISAARMEFKEAEYQSANDLFKQEEALSDWEQLLERYFPMLSATHQSTLQLVAEGFKYAEIAEIEGCPEGTVKTRVKHARERLKQLMNDGERDWDTHDD